MAHPKTTGKRIEGGKVGRKERTEDEKMRR